MTTRFSFAFVLILGLALIGCGGGDGSGRGGSGGNDDTNDGVLWPDGSSPDTTGGDDVPVPDQTAPDTTTPDTTVPDTTVPDTTVPDTTTPDTTIPDTTTPDTNPTDTNPTDTTSECTGTGNVAALKACAEGPADFDLTQVVVTYVYDKGYFVADASGAMQVYVGDTWAYAAPAVGDLVSVHVTEYGSYQNTAEVKATDALTALGSGNLAALILDISGGTLPDEAGENRAVKGTGFTATAVNGKDLVVSYGSAAGVALRVDSSAGMCAGTTFDLAAGVFVQFQETYRIQSFHAGTDLVNVDASTCTASDDSNWGFEEAGQQDPPADFEKASTGFVANVSADQAHGGSHACALTWTSTDNQDFVQGLYTPIAAGQTAHFGVWVYDNDPAGRLRPSLEFFDAAKAPLGKEYDGYSEDAAAWAQMTFDFQAPANAAFVRAFVRLYDVAGGWAGTATVYVDDWSLTVQ